MSSIIVKECYLFLGNITFFIATDEGSAVTLVSDQMINYLTSRKLCFLGKSLTPLRTGQQKFAKS